MMKKIVFILLLNVLASRSVICQPLYTLKISNESYTDLVDAKWKTSLAIHQLDFPMPNGYSLFDRPLIGDFTMHDGGAYMLNSDYFFIFSTFLPYNSLYARKSGSSISAKEIVTSAKDTILQVEWKNSGIIGNDSDNYVNFQMWVYKNTQEVQYRYGPSYITDTLVFNGKRGPAIEFMLFEFDNLQMLQLIEAHQLINDPLNPKDTASGNPQANYGQMTSVPLNGTVYRFVRSNSSGINNIINSTKRLETYPNPVSQTLFIGNLENDDQEIRIYNSLGLLVKQVSYYDKSVGIEMEGIPAGVYFIETDSIRMTKFVKLQ
jgi:hypothetical protein